MTGEGSSGDRRLLGVGVAACAACCAPLVPGLLAGLGLGGVAWAAVGSVVGLLVAAAVVAGLVVRRRRAPQLAACGVDEPVALAAPARRRTEAAG